MINEAIYALDEGVATAADLDRAMQLGASHPLGPLALADFVGLDVTLDILESVGEQVIIKARRLPPPETTLELETARIAIRPQAGPIAGPELAAL